MDPTPTNPPPIFPARSTRLRRFLVPEFLVLAACGLLIAGSLVRQGSAQATHRSSLLASGASTSAPCAPTTSAR